MSGNASKQKLVEFLRNVPLFSGLGGEDLHRLAGLMRRKRFTAGEYLFHEGDEGDWAYVIQEGRIEISKTSAGEQVVLAVRRAGEMIGEMALLEEARRMAGARALTGCRVLCLSKEQLDGLLAGSPSAARAMLHTVITRLRDTELLLRQSEKMAQLGILTAGVAHELNNPASAVLRGAGQLAVTLDRLRRGWEKIGALAPEQIGELGGMLERAASAEGRRPLPALEQSSREEELEAWLQEQGLEGLSEQAADLVEQELRVPDLDRMLRAFERPKLEGVVELLSAYYSASTLLREISQGAGQMASIVKALKGYSYLDQGPVQLVDIHESLENTLLLLRGKLKPAVTVRREYARELPRIQAHGSELNQVWTNLIDNAVDALGGKGEIRIRTRRDGEWLAVEIEDNGPGIPADLQPRLFTPFFTTKPVGAGTGQGLCISRNIVEKHAGRIRFRSHGGKTVFQVRLPVDRRPER
jgi:signal transduction histidine kinase